MPLRIVLLLSACRRQDQTPSRHSKNHHIAFAVSLTGPTFWHFELQCSTYKPQLYARETEPEPPSAFAFSERDLAVYAAKGLEKCILHFITHHT